MSATITTFEPPQEAPPAPNIPPNPSDILLTLIAALLAPIFFCVTNGDINLARMAAIETINAYRARDNTDLIAIAQIVGNGLAALSSLSLSMADDLSLNMTLRLRGNANACSRSAEQNRRAIRQNRIDISVPYDIPVLHQAAPVQPQDPEPEQIVFETFLNPDAANLLAAESEARLHTPVPEIAGQNNHTRAIAMLKEALKINAGIPNLPSAERQQATLRVAELNSTANQLLAGTNPPPPSFGPLEPHNLDTSQRPHR
jgi:hypothetical protein